MKGSALILTLWCVAVLSITIVTVARVVESDVESAGQLSRRFEARELALTGLALGLNPRIERDDPLLRQVLPDGSELQVLVKSEAARMNINEVLQRRGDERLADLFELWGVDDSAVRVAVDSLRDWVDENDIRSLNGAERPDLVNQTVYSLPENRDFISVAEMERVRGMDAVIAKKPDWREYFSVFSGGAYDIQDASVDILQAGGGLTREQALRVIETRNGPDGEPDTDDDFRFESVDDAAFQAWISEAQRQVLAQAFDVGVEPTRIESTATVGGLRYRITVVLERGDEGAETEFLSWEEG